MKEKLFHVAGFPNVLVPIKGPSVNKHLNVCRKGYRVHHALNRHIQSVADADYTFINIVPRWPGIDSSSHYAFIWGNCDLAGDLEQWQAKGWLLCDSAYPLPPWLLTTILNPVGRPQRRYNSVHCKTRVKIEHMFGIWKSRFRCLHKSGGGGSMMFRPKHCRPPLSWW